MDMVLESHLGKVAYLGLQMGAFPILEVDILERVVLHQEEQIMDHCLQIHVFSLLEGVNQVKMHLSLVVLFCIAKSFEDH